MLGVNFDIQQQMNDFFCVVPRRWCCSPAWCRRPRGGSRAFLFPLGRRPLRRQHQIIGHPVTQPCGQPARPAEPRASVQPERRHLARLQRQAQIPFDRIAHQHPHQRGQAFQPRAAGQQRLVGRQVERPEPEAAAMLALEAGDAHHCVDPKLRAGAAQPAAQPLGNVEPAADQLLEHRGHAQEILHEHLNALSMPALAADQAGMVQLEAVGQGIAVAQSGQTEPGERADIEAKAVLLRPIVLDVRPGVGPGAIEQCDQPVLEQVAEVDERVVARLPPPVQRVRRQMQRQRTAAAEQAEQEHGEPGRVHRRRRHERGEARRPRKSAAAPGPAAAAPRAPRAALPRRGASGLRAFEQPQRREEVEAPGPVAERGAQIR